MDDKDTHDDPWAVPDGGVPPVVGRRDPATRQPMMAYDTRGEISGPPDGELVDHYQTDDGVDVSVTF
ncbi:hypothetical protein [Micromonospora sp. DT31]|uniref:hypothetical protein n=1 Tax=Micromonospora sp. DT31 TaxID=3393434 RepID=UPI003CFACF2F